MNRSSLKHNTSNLLQNIIIIFDDISILTLIVKDLKELRPEIQVQVYHWDKGEIHKFPEYFDQNIINLDKKYIDFNFHTYLRHNGNKDHAKQYLKWETDLLEKMDEEEINFFKIGNIEL